MTSVIVPIGGWGRAGWGEGPWSQSGLPFATGAAGSVTVDAQANVPVTGLVASTTVGSVLVIAEANVSVTGVAGTGQVGNATVDAQAVVPVTGVAGTAAGGAVTVDAQAQVFPTGVTASGGGRWRKRYCRSQHPRNRHSGYGLGWYHQRDHYGRRRRDWCECYGSRGSSYN
jgi:hypothetical protein